MGTKKHKRKEFDLLRVRKKISPTSLIDGVLPKIGDVGIILDIYEEDGKFYYTMERAREDSADWVADFTEDEVEDLAEWELAEERLQGDAKESWESDAEEPKSVEQIKPQRKHRRRARSEYRPFEEVEKRPAWFAFVLGSLLGGLAAFLLVGWLVPNAPWVWAATLGISTGFIGSFLDEPPFESIIFGFIIAGLVTGIFYVTGARGAEVFSLTQVDTIRSVVLALAAGGMAGKLTGSFLA